MVRNTTIIGVLAVTLLLLSGIIIVQFGDKARIRVDEDKSTFYVKDGYYWKVSGREYNRLFDGTKQLYRDAQNVRVNNYSNGDEFVIQRTTPYKRGPIIIDTYVFSGDVNDIEQFPIDHNVCVFNGKDYFYRYSLDDLKDTGDKRKLTTETSLSFGLNMKVEFEPGYRWAWIGYPYGSDSFSAQYDIDSDFECFSMRFFDPVSSSVYIYQETADSFSAADSNYSDPPAGIEYAYFNYTIPNSTYIASSAKWLVKHGNLSPYNISIPDSCFSYDDTLILRIESVSVYDVTQWSQPYCYNGSWITVGQNSSQPFSGGSFAGSYSDLMNDGDWSTSACYVGAFPSDSDYWLANSTDGGTIFEEAMYWFIAPNLNLEDFRNDIDVELGSSITVNATYNGTVCVDVDHPDYGVNHSCDTDTVQFDLNITYFQNTTIYNATVTNYSIQETANSSVASFSEYTGGYLTSIYTKPSNIF
jgi:hypothetical protein